jgi:hypothetical protein
MLAHVIPLLHMGSYIQANHSGIAAAKHASTALIHMSSGIIGLTSSGNYIFQFLDQHLHPPIRARQICVRQQIADLTDTRPQGADLIVSVLHYFLGGCCPLAPECEGGSIMRFVIH